MGDTLEEAKKRAAEEAASGNSSTKEKDTDVVWTRESLSGNPVAYKGKTAAYNYLTVNSPEYNLVYDNWQALKGTDLGSKNVMSFWKKVVDKASANGASPWDIMNYYIQGGKLPDGTDTTGTDGTLTAAEKARLAELKNINLALSSNPESDLTGEAGKVQGALVQYVDAMGLMKGMKEVNSYVKDIYENKFTADDVKDNLRKQASVLYSNFADRLNADPSLTVRDLVNPYLQVMADTLEIDPKLVKLTDPTIQNAISGTKLRSLTDFRNDMRNDSRFATTRTAKREATDLATSLLKGFGYSI